MKVPMAIVVPMSIYKSISAVAFDRLEMLRNLAQVSPMPYTSPEAVELAQLELWSDWESEQYELGVLH